MPVSMISRGANVPVVKGDSLPSLENVPHVIPRKEEKIHKVALFLFHLLSLPISSFVVRGLAKIFDFEVLRHGTSGYFHVFKDSEVRRGGAFENLCVKVISPKLHAVLAGVASVPAFSNSLLQTLMKVLAAIGNCFCPTLHFVYRKTELQGLEAGREEKRFENDPDYNGLAYRTHSALSNDRIGLVGICCHATPNDLSRAWKNNRCQCVLGIIMVLAGSILSLMGLGFVT